MLPPGSFVASGPVIIEDRRVLLCRHGDDASWKFPGGRVEPSDADLESAARREAKEELGIDVRIVRPLKPMVLALPDGRTAVLIHYLAERRGDIAPGADIRDWTWAPIDALPPDCAPNVRPVLDEAAAAYR